MVYNCPINTTYADKVTAEKERNKIVILTRFAHGEHKGANIVEKLLCKDLEGRSLEVIIGSGGIDENYRKTLFEKANNNGIRLAIHNGVSEKDKWKLIKMSKVMIFTSYFEVTVYLRLKHYIAEASRYASN